MKVFLIIAFLGIALAEECPTYVKKGCLKQNRNVFAEQVANNRDSNSNVYTGKMLDWHNYAESLAELGCACAKIVKEKGGVAFAMGFYGECWMATDKDALDNYIKESQSSAKCIGHDYGDCNNGHTHCVGNQYSEYVYSFPSAAPPAIDGGFGDWSEWTQCSATCGEGFIERERVCNNPLSDNGGKDCPSGELTETKTCKIIECPVNGKWGAWNEFETCPVTCGGASQKRTRKCDSPAPAHGGASCPGSDEESQSCGTIQCPIDGKWSTWGAYETCPVTCGGASQKRTRKCDNPTPAHGGALCPGSDEESQSCGTIQCPVNGNWGEWTSYGVCSKSCASGSQVRTRKCNNPAPKYNGAKCPGSSSSSKSCNTQNCPINGNWGAWTSYGVCSKSCGGGSQDRTRKCNNPAPKYNGASCVGESSTLKSCNTHSCPIDAKWGSWGSYGSCSKTCHYGTQTRKRACSGARFNGKTTCPGSDKETRNCNVNRRCPYWTGEYTARVCEGKSQWIRCSDSHQVIKLQQYFWGRTTKSHCRGGVDWLWSTSCKGGHGRIRQNCENRNSCNLQANNNWMNDDPCWGTPKYAEIKYKCYG